MSVGRAPVDVIPSVPNDQRQAEIFMLKVDHFEELFDWLSLKDLVSLSQTCKRMQRIVGFCFQTNYAALKFESTSDGIEITNREINLNGLSSFVKKLSFCYLEHFDHLNQKKRTSTQTVPSMEPDQLKSLTEILLTGVVFTEAGISRIKGILGQLNTVKLKFPHFLDENQEFYDEFLQFCTSINRLCVEGSGESFIVGTDNSWLQRKYPTLEHFELTDVAGPLDELKLFLDQNTNVKTFATNIEMILANTDVFKTTKAKWDVLSVEFDAHNKFSLYRSLLNELYDSGIFKELHVYFFTLFDVTFNQESVNQLVSFDGLTKIYVDGMKNGTDLSPLINLKQLCITRASGISNMITLATKLINLEFIQFTYASVRDLLPFIRYSSKLTTIVVFCLEKSNKFIFNIEKLNRKRTKLSNARKITVFVQEQVYLDLKWAKNRTQWNLIEVKRGESFDKLKHSFDYMDNPDTTFGTGEQEN